VISGGSARRAGLGAHREKYGVSPKNTAGWLARVQQLAPVVGSEGTIEVNLFATAGDAAGAGGQPQAEWRTSGAAKRSLDRVT
jgi:hypothetical protein